MVIKKRRMRIFPKIDRGRAKGSVKIGGTEIKSRSATIRVTRRVNKNVSSANIKLVNDKQQYTGKWSGGEIVQVYLDFAVGNTQIFEGRLIKTDPSFSQYPVLDIEAHGYGREAKDVKVSKTYESETDIGQIFEDLLEEYLPSHTYSGVKNPTGYTAAPEWQGKPLFECFVELITTYSNDNLVFYCDYDKDWQLLERGERSHGKTSGVAIVYGQNLRRLDINDPFVEKRNKITVVGRTEQGLKIMSTKEDSDDQERNWVMHEIIQDNNITTQAQAESKAKYILKNKLDPPKSGKALIDGNPNILPGYYVLCFDPNNNINGWIMADSVMHMISSNGYYTEVEFDEGKPLVDPRIKVIKDRIDTEQRRIDLDNKRGMENSYPIPFDDDSDIDSHTHTEIKNSELKLQVGETSGTAVIKTKTADKDITKVYLDPSDTDMEYSSYYVSVNSGVSWESVEPRTVTEMSGSGKNMKCKVEMVVQGNATNPSLKSLVILYK